MNWRNRCPASGNVFYGVLCRPLTCLNVPANPYQIASVSEDGKGMQLPDSLLEVLLPIGKKSFVVRGCHGKIVVVVYEM